MGWAGVEVVLLLRGGGERDVPDVGLAADVHDGHEIFVRQLLVATQDDRVVRVDLGKPREFVAELIQGQLLAVHHHRPVLAHVEHGLVGQRLLLLGGAGGGDFHVQLVFRDGEVPRDDEEHEEDKQDVHHRGNLEAEQLRLGAFAEVHRR